MTTPEVSKTLDPAIFEELKKQVNYKLKAIKNKNNGAEISKTEYLIVWHLVLSLFKLEEKITKLEQQIANQPTAPARDNSNNPPEFELPF